jgi:hypothetical protein
VVKPLLALALGLALAAPARTAAAAAEAAQPTEHEVKAAFLFHFARLTEWPPEALPDGQPFVVGVLGEDPFGRTLDRILEGQAIHGRPAQVRRLSSLEELREPLQILFVSTSERGHFARVLRRLQGTPVLTVSEEDGFAEAGGMVNFVLTPEGRVRFEINQAESEAAGLRMSSQVLKLARIVVSAPR